MDSLLQDINWIAVVVGAIAAFVLGALWYSPKLFGTKWAAGSRIDMNDRSGMMPAMLAQAVGTFLLAWVIGITETTNSIGFAILIALTIAVLVKAGGLFAKKSKYAVMVDSGFVLAMVAVMILAQALF